MVYSCLKILDLILAEIRIEFPVYPCKFKISEFSFRTDKSTGNNVQNVVVFVYKNYFFDPKCSGLFENLKPNPEKLKGNFKIFKNFRLF